MSDDNPHGATLLAVLRKDLGIVFLHPEVEALRDGERDGAAVLEHLADKSSDVRQVLERVVEDGQPCVSSVPPLIYEPTRDPSGTVDGVVVYRRESAPESERLEALYAEVCRAHDAITVFRAKLLAALPVLSGAGGALLLANADAFDRLALVPLGLFGALITLGLLVHELRGLVVCHELRKRGEQLERALQVPASRRAAFLGGQFSDIKPHNPWRDALPWGKHGDGESLGGLIGAVTACWIVYGTVLLAWVGLAVWGLISH